MSFVAAIIAAALGISGPIASSIMKGTVGRDLKQRLLKLLQQNTVLQNKLQLAYNDKNQKLMNSLLMSSPIGPAYKSIKDELAKTNKEYADKSAELQAEASKLQNYQNDIESAITDPKYVGLPGVISSVNSLVHTNKQLTAAEQSMNGGIVQNG